MNQYPQTVDNQMIVDSLFLYGEQKYQDDTSYMV